MRLGAIGGDWMRVGAIGVIERDWMPLDVIGCDWVRFVWWILDLIGWHCM
jgi:hypothetical protein